MDGHTHSASNSYVGSSYNFTNIAVGKKVWFNYSWWRCIHIDGNLIYLTTDTIEHFMNFSTSRYTYSGSIVANFCTTFYETLYPECQALCQDVTVEDVTNKVFIPDRTMVSGGFSYYNSNANRVAKHYITGENSVWWIAGSFGTSYHYVIKPDGSVNSDGLYGTITSNHGFRPHVAVTI